MSDSAINTQNELDEEIEVYFQMYSHSFDKTNWESKYISSLQKKRIFYWNSYLLFTSNLIFW